MDDDCNFEPDYLGAVERPAPADEGFEAWEVRFEIEQERLAERTDLEWHEELADTYGKRVRSAVDLLVSGGVDRARLLSDLRELEDLARPALGRTSAREFGRLVGFLRRAEERLDGLRWSDGFWCLPEPARAAVDGSGIPRLRAELEAFRSSFPAALRRSRKRYLDLQRRITRQVDRQIRARGRIGKLKQHAELAFLFGVVTATNRTVHAQRVSTARLRQGTVARPSPRKAEPIPVKGWEKNRRKRPKFVGVEEADKEASRRPGISHSSEDAQYEMSEE